MHHKSGIRGMALTVFMRKGVDGTVAYLLQLNICMETENDKFILSENGGLTEINR